MRASRPKSRYRGLRLSLLTIPALVAGVLLSHALAAPPADRLRALGEKFFFDVRLSKSGSISCATCHQPERAFTDGRDVAVGFEAAKGTRNTPSLLNISDQSSFTWDGRTPQLEVQVLDPLTNAVEHGYEHVDEVERVLAGLPDYSEEVSIFFPGQPRAGVRLLTGALVAYVSKLDAGPSRFDRYWANGEVKALSEAERRGFELFRGVGGCSTCHQISSKPARLTDGKFHRISASSGASEPATRSIQMRRDQRYVAISRDISIAALGRFNVTERPADIGGYRTPSLRNVAITAPYMHDGSIGTLAEAVDLEIYYRSGVLGRPISLTPAERANLVAFLNALTSESFEFNKGSR